MFQNPDVTPEKYFAMVLDLLEAPGQLPVVVIINGEGMDSTLNEALEFPGKFQLRKLCGIDLPTGDIEFDSDTIERKNQRAEFTHKLLGYFIEWHCQIYLRLTRFANKEHRRQFERKCWELAKNHFQ